MKTTIDPAAVAPEARASGTRVWRHLATGILGSAVFGAAAMTGHGVHAIAHGAWMAPTLFAGGTLLAMPPQYLFTALAGGRTTPADVLTSSARALAAIGTVLLGLAAPAAFFSVTVHTLTASVLLVLATVSLGTLGIAALTHERMRGEDAFGPRAGALAWFVFAIALGARLMLALARHAGWI